jgi:hypothetical protein
MKAFLALRIEHGLKFLRKIPEPTRKRKLNNEEF